MSHLVRQISTATEKSQQRRADRSGMASKLSCFLSAIRGLSGPRSFLKLLFSSNPYFVGVLIFSVVIQLPAPLESPTRAASGGKLLQHHMASRSHTHHVLLLLPRSDPHPDTHTGPEWKKVLSCIACQFQIFWGNCRCIEMRTSKQVPVTITACFPKECSARGLNMSPLVPCGAWPGMHQCGKCLHLTSGKNAGRQVLAAVSTDRPRS